MQDLPCFIIYPPALDEVERSNGVRKKSYTVRLRLLVKDADLDKAAAFVDSYREAVVNAFDTELTLNGTAKLITGPRAEEASAFDYAGRSYTGIDFLLGVQIEEPMSFEP